MRKILSIIMLGIILSGCTVVKITPESSGSENNSTYDEKDETPVVIEKEKDPQNTEEEQSQEEQPPLIDYEQVKPNELGHIMIVMYHGIMDAPPYHRTPDDFRKDLKYMYDHGYRLITMRDYIDNNIDVAPGMTPIVLTFDDGLETTFSLMEENGQLVPVPDTAVAILEEFSQEYPDFGKAAIFYINSELKVFEGAGTEEERLQWLVDHGYEVGNHTSVHANLAKLSADQLQEHIGKTDSYIKDKLGEDYLVDSLAYPFGSRPEESLRDYILTGTYEGHTYHQVMALKEGPSGPFIVPYHKDFDPLLVPRVRGSEGDIQDLWWFFDYYENHQDRRYISDGNKELISIPKAYEEDLNEEALNGKEVYLY